LDSADSGYDPVNMIMKLRVSVEYLVPKKSKVTGGVEMIAYALFNLYPSSSIIRMIKLRAVI
jgi:hypothetical protein